MNPADLFYLLHLLQRRLEERIDLRMRDFFWEKLGHEFAQKNATALRLTSWNIATGMWVRRASLNRTRPSDPLRLTPRNSSIAPGCHFPTCRLLPRPSVTHKAMVPSVSPSTRTTRRPSL